MGIKRETAEKHMAEGVAIMAPRSHPSDRRLQAVSICCCVVVLPCSLSSLVWSWIFIEENVVYIIWRGGTVCYNMGRKYLRWQWFQSLTISLAGYELWMH